MTVGSSPTRKVPTLFIIEWSLVPCEVSTVAVEGSTCPGMGDTFCRQGSRGGVGAGERPLPDIVVASANEAGLLFLRLPPGSPCARPACGQCAALPVVLRKASSTRDGCQSSGI